MSKYPHSLFKNRRLGKSEQMEDGHYRSGMQGVEGHTVKNWNPYIRSVAPGSQKNVHHLAYLLGNLNLKCADFDHQHQADVGIRALHSHMGTLEDVDDKVNDDAVFGAGEVVAVGMPSNEVAEARKLEVGDNIPEDILGNNGAGKELGPVQKDEVIQLWNVEGGIVLDVSDTFLLLVVLTAHDDMN